MVQSRNAGGNIAVAAPWRYTRIFSDTQGESHFADLEMSFQLADFAPPAPPISISAALKAEGVLFISSPPGWYGDWHPAPRRQLIICLAGELEVEVSDGEVRRFAPGSVTLVEDVTGKGHVSKVVSDERIYMAVVPLTQG